MARRTLAVGVAIPALLTGAVLTRADSRAATLPPPVTNAAGWVIADTAGGVHDLDAPALGSVSGSTLAAPVVGVAATPDGRGYDLVGADGGVFTFGDAAFHGSAGDLRLARPIVGMATDPATGGYWLVASDGGVFAYDAPFYGSAAPLHPARPIVGIAADPAGDGYWLVGADGGVFSFGGATFAGSAADEHLAKPVVGMATDPATGGYWLVASDGGVFAYDAPFEGSAGGVHLARPIVGLAATPSGLGYSLVAADGGVFAYNSPYHGSWAGRLTTPVVGIAATAYLPLAVATTALPSAQTGVSYPPAALAAEGGDGGLTWTASGLPPGMMVSTGGTVTGTPTTPGDYQVTATVTDASGESASGTVALDVDPPASSTTTTTAVTSASG